MKILIDNGSPLRVYHNPRDVIIHPKTNTVEIFSSDGTTLETFVLVKKKLEWMENKDTDTSEILVTLHVM
jgi:hypothetical protein